VRWENHPEAGEIRGSVVVPEHFNGYPGVVHGGIVATLLDETAGRTVLLTGPRSADGDRQDRVVYRRPTPTGTPLTLVGRFLRHVGDRAEAHGEVRLPDGTVSAPMLDPARPSSQEIAARWDSERAHWKVDEE